MNMITQELKSLHEEFTSRGFQLRLVGGCVRDFLLGKEPKDIDLCTDATPDEMMAMASPTLKVVPTGIEHGTVTFVYTHSHDDGIPTYSLFEVTTLRIDVQTDGRHAEVEFTRSFSMDAMRRDLTINAMSMDFDGTVYDYFGGREDLSGEFVKVRFVGSAAARISEDYLRILRYFRFAARFEAEMDSEDLNTIQSLREGLDGISRERVWAEMSKLFVAQDRVWAFKSMRSCNVDTQIGLPRHALGSAFNLESADCAEAAVAFFFDKEDDARTFCQSWKMSSAETNKVAFLVANRFTTVNEDAVEDFLVDGVKRDWVVSWVLMQDVDPEHAETFVPPVFPVTGQDLLDRGMKPGKEVGLTLAAMRKVWVESRFGLTKAQLLN